jgi:doubled CXXCH motif protein
VKVGSGTGDAIHRRSSTQQEKSLVRRTHHRGAAFGALATVLLAVAGLVAGCSRAPAGEQPPEGVVPEAPGAELQVNVPPPPFSEGVFPCSSCHDPELPVNTKPRKLKLAHQQVELKHGTESRWCLDCHDAADRDQLHLASGEKVPFEESYRLCGQCHGEKFRDWRAGVHGRRTGHWDGEKQYLLCVHCHNSHAPRFAPVKPESPPIAPRRTE